MCSKGVQVLHRTCKPAASWRFTCPLKRFPFGGWPINLGPARRSSVGILQRMPKPGSFASRSCTLSEHLRARPKHLRLPRKEANDQRLTPQMHPPQSALQTAHPTGKESLQFVRCFAPTLRLSPTHNDLRVALLLQIMFAGATRVRCHPGGGAKDSCCLLWGKSREAGKGGAPGMGVI